MLHWLRRLFCRHEFRDSTTWPGVMVCRKCGYRRVAS
jgi:hypothetical protein